MTMTTTRAEPAMLATRYELLQLIDAAVWAWARRDVQPERYVHQALDDLERAWMAARAAQGDEVLETFRLAPEAPPPPAPTRPAQASGDRPDRRAGDVARTQRCRARKADEDGYRITYIVKRYATLVRQSSTPKQARERVAGEIRRHLHLPPARRAGRRPSQYSAQSVARVLKNFTPS